MKIYGLSVGFNKRDPLGSLISALILHPLVSETIIRDSNKVAILLVIIRVKGTAHGLRYAKKIELFESFCDGRK